MEETTLQVKVTQMVFLSRHEKERIAKQRFIDDFKESFGAEPDDADVRPEYSTMATYRKQEKYNARPPKSRFNEIIQKDKKLNHASPVLFGSKDTKDQKIYTNARKFEEEKERILYGKMLKVYGLDKDDVYYKNKYLTQ